MIDVLPLWVVAIPLAYLASFIPGQAILWVYLAMSSEQLVKALVGVWRLRSGKWINDLTRIGQE